MMGCRPSGLDPATPYGFAIAALVENQTDDEWRVAALDRYGRRAPLPHALVGAASPYANASGTLALDVRFDRGFTANATVNHSASDARATLGPMGVFAGEGHYGLTLVGDASVEVRAR